MTTITDFSHGYTPPGVYIAETSQPISNTTGIPVTRLTIIGRGQGERTSTEQVPLTTDPGVRLAMRGIREDSVVVTVVSDDTILAPTNYTVTQVTNSDDPQDWWVEIHRVSDSETPDGTTVWVSYAYTPVDYYRPRLFTQPSDVADVYGPGFNYSLNPTDPDFGVVNSPLTLAAEVAFANGAGEILAVPLEILPSATSPQVRAAISAAYTQIETDYSTSIVVPLTDGLDSDDSVLAASDLRGHLASASNAGYYRVGVYGQPLGDTNTPQQLITNGGASYRRLILAYAAPEGMMYRNTSAGRVLLGHQYLAVAYGAILAANPVAQSLTRQRVAGFAGLGGALTSSVKNQYAAAGVALTEIDRQSRMIVRHGTSTDRNDLVSAEPSVTRARDVMVTLIQNSLDNTTLIGSPMDNNSPLAVKSIVAGALEFCVAQAVIVEYNGLQVRIASANPSVIDVRFSYRPSFPLNYITVSFSIDLNTGDTGDINAELANNNV